MLRHSEKLQQSVQVNKVRQDASVGGSEEDMLFFVLQSGNRGIIDIRHCSTKHPGMLTLFNLLSTIRCLSVSLVSEL